MIPLKFNYRTIPGKRVIPLIPEEQKADIENCYTNYLLKNDNIISPRVEVLMSNDATRVIRCWIIADGVLK